MNRSKERTSAKKGFERKIVNGKPNAKYVDYVCPLCLPKILLNKSKCFFSNNS